VPSQRQQIEPVRDLSIDRRLVTKRMGTGQTALVVFTDFECPYCGAFARETVPTIRQAFVEGGKLTLVSIAMPLERIHPHARRASEAAECASRQGKFWPMHDRLYSDQSALVADALLTSARAVGLDMTHYEQCMQQDGPAAVAEDVQEARRLNVNATPTLFIGRFRDDGSIQLLKRVNGAAPAQQVEMAINEVVNQG
jgi:protein-disulfide isomerase